MSASPQEADGAELVCGDANTELSSNRTSLSFERTRMSSDRTLMSTVRTSLSLISFGFTIFQFFHKLNDMLKLGGSGAPARDFGIALVLLGVGMLVFGIGYHLAFMYQLRAERRRLKERGWIHAESSFPASLTLIVAVSLLIIGVLAVTSMAFRVGPFA